MIKGKQSKKRRNYFRIDSSFSFWGVKVKSREFAFDTIQYFFKHRLINAATNAILHPMRMNKFLGYAKSANAFIIVYENIWNNKIHKSIVGWFENADDVDLPEI
jgi:hypothetical protein